MRSTSRGYEQAPRSIFFSLVLLTHAMLFAISPASAEGRKNENIIVLEFSAEGIDEDIARGYFDEARIFLREELGLHPMKLSSLRVKTDGPHQLPPLPADMVFTFKNKLEGGKEYFNNLEFAKGAQELRDLIESPYAYRLDGKALDLVSEAMLAYAFILFKTGDRDGGGKLISRYILLSGKEEISDQLFPPDFISFFHDIREMDRYFTLAVNTTPSGAQVFLGQNSVGTSPLIGKMRTFGHISLSIRKEGYVQRVINRVALPGDRLNFDLPLEIDEISQIESNVGRGDLEAVAINLEKIGSRVNAPAGLVFVLKGDAKPWAIDTVISVGSRRRGDWDFAINRDIPKKDPSFNKRDFHHLFTDDLFLRIVPDREKAMALGETISKKKITQRWWFWAILGAGAAGVIYAAISENDKKSTGSVNVEF